MGLSGVVGGRAATLTSNILSGRNALDDYWNPLSMGRDAAPAILGTLAFGNLLNLATKGNRNYFTDFLPRPRIIDYDETRLLAAGSQTTHNLKQVKWFRGKSNTERGDVAEQYIAELTGGDTNVPGESVGQFYGLRHHDVRVRKIDLETRFEVKNYLPKRGTLLNEVPIEPFNPIDNRLRGLRFQAVKDYVWMRSGRLTGNPRYVRWEFVGAPPSDGLAEWLRRLKIDFNHRR